MSANTSRIVASIAVVFILALLFALPVAAATKTYSDGARYEGEMKNGTPDGQGTVTYSDGSKYTGGFKDGKK